MGKKNKSNSNETKEIQLRFVAVWLFKQKSKFRAEMYTDVRNINLVINNTLSYKI